jgi:quercetin dioxygenase-like cupin family protein
MQSKPMTSGQPEARARNPRTPSAVPTGQARTSDPDLARAEGEVIGSPVPDSFLSSDAERHEVRYGPLSRNVIAFDLASEAKQIALPHDATHTARTLSKLDAMRLTLMKLNRGARIPEHQVSYQVSLQTVSGHVVVHVEGQAVEMPAGHVIVLAREVAHDIAARDDSVVLVTVSSPP